jgi:hypothetical protein
MKHCKNCGSTGLYNFRLDSDWGASGSFTPVNPGTPGRDRCDMDTFVCVSCYTVGDDICIPSKMPQANPLYKSKGGE